MKKFIPVIYLILLVSVFFSGRLTSPEKTVIKEVEVIKNVDRVVYRDYSNIDCCVPLKHYDEDPMLITYKINGISSGYTGIDLSWRLYERSGEQSIKVPCGQSGDWKLYTGLIIGAVAVGGLVWLIK